MVGKLNHPNSMYDNLKTAGYLGIEEKSLDDLKWIFVFKGSQRYIMVNLWVKIMKSLYLQL